MLKRRQPGPRRAPPTLLAVALAVSLLASASAARAGDEAGKPVWTLGGFGSVGVVHASERQADFVSNILKANGAGFTHRWSADVDSRLGAQLGVKLDPQWSAVLQLIAEQGVDNSYAPIVEWANVKYQATPDLSVRVGRIALPMFLAADYRKVAYAFPWVRTPVEVYGAIPVSSSDGVDLSYRWQRGDITNVTQVFYGSTNIKGSEHSRTKARDVNGISNSTEYGALSVRVGLFSGNLTTDAARRLFDGFRQFGPQGVALADKYDLDHKRALGMTIGANYDPGKWFVMGEVGRTRVNAFLGDKITGYASAGYRFGNFTPYLAYSQVRTNSDTSDPGLALTGLPAPVAGAAAALNAGLNRTLTMIAMQKTLTAGVRWDVKPDLAFKLQYDRVRPQGSSGMLVNVQPAYQAGAALHVVSAVLDFVY
jgi:hypothetical protein